MEGFSKDGRKLRPRKTAGSTVRSEKVDFHNSESHSYGEHRSYGERRRYFMGDELDGTMNYPLRDVLLDYINYTI